MQKSNSLLYRKNFFILFLISEICYLFVLASNTSEELKKCESHLAVNINRSTRNEGFHRELVTDYEFDSLENLTGFHFLLIEHLPPDIYADPHEVLARKQDSGPQIYFKDHVNVETPAHKSPPMDVYIFFLDRLTLNTVLPIHLRYQKPQECYKDGHYKEIILKNPSLYYREKKIDTYSCNSITAPCDSTNTERCNWHAVRVSYNVSELIFSVPVGCTEHETFVTAITFFTVAVATAFLCYTFYQKNAGRTSHSGKAD